MKRTGKHPNCVSSQNISSYILFWHRGRLFSVSKHTESQIKAAFWRHRSMANFVPSSIECVSDRFVHVLNYRGKQPIFGLNMIQRQYFSQQKVASPCQICFSMGNFDTTHRKSCQTTCECFAFCQISYLSSSEELVVVQRVSDAVITQQHHQQVQRSLRFKCIEIWPQLFQVMENLHVSQGCSKCYKHS